MVERYPDHITVTSYSDATQGTGRNWSIPTGETTFATGCRFQPAGANNVISGNNGDEITYSYKVFLRKTTSDFEFGDSVTGVCGGRSFSGKIKGHHNRQTHSVIWV